MMLFLILAPFGTFAALMLIASQLVSLFGASAVAIGTIGYDIARGKSVKALAAGAAILFAAIGAYLALADGGLDSRGIRLAVDVGVLAIALGSSFCACPSRCNTPANPSIRKPHSARRSSPSITS